MKQVLGTTLLFTGFSGLIGSEVAKLFDGLGLHNHGVDNNRGAVFLGPRGDTRWNLERLEQSLKSFTHHDLNIRNREGVLRLIDAVKPDAIVHTAATSACRPVACGAAASPARRTRVSNSTGS